MLNSKPLVLFLAAACSIGGAFADPQRPALPAPVVNVAALFAAIENMGYIPTLRDDGVLELDMGNGENFVGKFSAYPYRYGGDNTAECSTIEIVELEVSPQLRYSARCNNGLNQDIIPTVDNPAFYTMLESDGLQYSIGNRYGTVFVKDIDVFYPDYYVRPLQDRDRELLESGTSGTVLRVDSINQGGSVNYEVLTATGRQLFFGGREVVIEGEFIPAGNAANGD
ncbi:MAG: hypothetical protein Q7L19_15875 [Pseudohongiella sp.]|nr:hypothetical protein [Pseudohongiella sp.]